MTLSLAAIAPPSAIPPEGGGEGAAPGCRSGGSSSREDSARHAGHLSHVKGLAGRSFNCHVDVIRVVAVECETKGAHAMQRAGEADGSLYHHVTCSCCACVCDASRSRLRALCDCAVGRACAFGVFVEVLMCFDHFASRTDNAVGAAGMIACASTSYVEYIIAAIHCVEDRFAFSFCSCPAVGRTRCKRDRGGRCSQYACERVPASNGGAASNCVGFRPRWTPLEMYGIAPRCELGRRRHGCAHRKCRHQSCAEDPA